MNQIERLEKVNAIVQSEFGKMSDEQLNWKPSKDKWSIAECLLHLVKSNSTYFPGLDDIINGKQSSFWEKANPLSRSIGKSMLKSLGVSIKRKHKSPELFRPDRPSNAVQTIQTFINHQDALIDKFKKLEAFKNMNRNITSPVSKLITLPLTDCLEILTGHEERHLNQAIELTKQNTFPGSK